YQWISDRGLMIVKVALQAIEYDEDTRELLSDVKKADALAGRRGNSFMQQAAARGFQAAGENPGGPGGGAGMAFLGMGVNAASGAVGGMQQPNVPPYQQQAPQQQAPPPAPAAAATAEPQAPSAEDPVAKLQQLKTMLDQGLITQDDYDTAKANVLGL